MYSRPSTPQVKTAPAVAGPTARPTPLNVVATPFKVPRMLRDEAELVSMMVTQGKPKMPAKPLSVRTTIRARNRAYSPGTKLVKGVIMYAIGNRTASGWELCQS